MPVQRTLLERLREPDPPGERRARVSIIEIENSILRNLQNLLNTCRGNAPIDPDYGLPHLTDVRSKMPQSIGGFEAAIRNTIERYEPRLRQVRVRHAPQRDDVLELRFEIVGVIEDEDGRTPVRFTTVAAQDGRVEVRFPGH